MPGQPPYPAPGQPGAGYPYPPAGPAAPGPDPQARRRALIGWVAAGVAVALLATGAIVAFGGDGDDTGAVGDRDGAPTAPRLPGDDGGEDAGEGSDGDASDAATGGGTGGRTGGDSGGSTGDERPGGVAVPAHTTGPDRTVITIGDADSAHTLTVYEDMRCPACAMFEQRVGDTLTADIEAGRYKAEFKMATFLDGNFGGDGSKNALSALGAALDVGPDAFLAYKKALYSERHHPEESGDRFASDAYLLQVAREVPELRNDATFARKVTDGTYERWADAVGDAFAETGVSGVPALELDGEKVTSGGSGPPMSAAEYTEAVRRLL
ncbi:thioredoxin domain-containing protein [Streptomyces pactum]|uniref:thioredoxin domain-containing protein n=1 Tax=Streptomyces pactum TaxID=68249 RepID=UPI003700F342